MNIQLANESELAIALLQWKLQTEEDDEQKSYARKLIYLDKP